MYRRSRVSKIKLKERERKYGGTRMERIWWGKEERERRCQRDEGGICNMLQKEKAWEEFHSMWNVWEWENNCQSCVKEILSDSQTYGGKKGWNGSTIWIHRNKIKYLKALKIRWICLQSKLKHTSGFWNSFTRHK